MLLKRCLDVVLSFLALLLLTPLLALIAVLVFLDSGRPVLFRQQRVGRAFRCFEILKFRTMRVESGGPAITAAGDHRITKIGKLLRNTKLDELPQLWNVLRGDMSLVGPRPEVPPYVELFRDRYRRILTLRPGITDLASIQFRNEEHLLASSSDPVRAYVETVLPAKLDLNERYVSQQSAMFDLRILYHTVLVTICGSGRN